MKTVFTLLCTMAFFVSAEVKSQEATEPPPEVSLDGLELVDKTRHREFYRAPAVDWSVYEEVLIDEASVTFRKNWLRDQNRYQTNRIRSEDMERIQSDMARMFNKALSDELTANGGYRLAEAPGENVLRITPHIVDLDVYAPDPRSAPGIQRSYTETAGRMSLELNLLDSQTGKPVAVFNDQREAPRRGYIQWANTVSNNQEFRIMLKAWARDLREGLEEVRKQSANAYPSEEEKS